MNKIALKNTLHHIGMSLIIVVLVAGVLAKIGLRFSMVDPAMQHWNDELDYFQMTASVAKYGHPLGYFGYNESRAQYGGFGSWNPLIMFFYAPFYLLQNGSTLSIYHANLFLMCLAMFIFFQWNHCSWKECLLYSVPLLAGQIVRYSYSGLSEAMYWFLTILIICCIIHRENPRIYRLGLFLTAYASITRMYMLIYLLPLMFSEGTSRKRCIQFIILSVSVLLISSTMDRFFSAAYIRPSLRTDELKNALLEGPASAFSFIAANFYEMTDFIRNGIGYGERRAVLYLICCITAVFLVIRSIVRYIRHQMTLHDRMLNLVYFAGFLVMINTYYIGETDRHLFILAMFIWFLLIHEDIMEQNRPMFAAVLAIVLIGTDAVFFRNSENVWLYDEENLYHMPELTELDPDGEDLYDNTIAYEFDTDFNSFRSLYDVQPGMGISFCQSSYLMDLPQIRSKYVFLSGKSECLDIYDSSSDWEKFAENEKCVLFVRKDS